MNIYKSSHIYIRTLDNMKCQISFVNTGHLSVYFSVPNFELCVSVRFEALVESYKKRCVLCDVLILGLC